MPTEKCMFSFGNSSVLTPWEQYKGGGYFVNIFTQGDSHFLGNINNGEIELSELGKYLDATLRGLHERYPFAQIPVFVIMPDHVNLILIIQHDEKQPSKCPDSETAEIIPKDPQNLSIHELASRCVLLSTAVNGIKASVRQQANKQGIAFEWQAGYHNRLIHDADEFFRVAVFMENHPGKMKKKSL